MAEFAPVALKISPIFWTEICLVKWLNKKDWHFRENTARRKSNSKKGSHPSLIVGIDNDSYANIGLTSQKKRGHHNNIKLSKNPNPENQDNSFLRTDLQIHNKKHLVKILKNYKLSNDDIDKVLSIIDKYINKKR